MTVYADVVFLANFISVLSLLLGYSAVFGGKIRIDRLILSGLVSGLYAVCEAVLMLPHIMRFAMLIFLAVIAFGRKNILYNTARLAFVAVCVEVLFIAVMSAMGKPAHISDGSVMVFCSGILGMAVYFSAFPLFYAIKKHTGERMLNKYAEFVINGQKTALTLLYDSGNFLMHKGVCVAVVSWESISGLFPGIGYDDFLINAEDRIICNTVSAGGILPVIVPEKSVIDGSEVKIKIAVSQCVFNGYDGVVGKVKNRNYA